MSATPHPAPSPVEAEVRRLQALVENQAFAQALAGAQALATRVPDNRDVLYLIAVAQRCLKRVDSALQTLQRLEELHPRFGRLHQERGHCYVALRDAPRAIDALLRAVNLNPVLSASWTLLRGLYQITGQPELALTADQHVAHLASLAPEVVAATGLFCDGDLQAAEALVRPFLLRHPDHIEAMRLLARIGIELDVVDDAQFLLESVLEQDPDYHAARYDYVRVLLKRHRHERALEELEALLAVDPGNAAYRTTYATAHASLGDNERAVSLYGELIREAPQAPDLHLSVAHALKTLGRGEAAIEAYRTAAALRPGYGEAYWSLANLKTYRFTDDELGRMSAAEAGAHVPSVDRYHLCFALGKALEDRGDYARSYAYYERGNALKRAELRYRPELIERNAQLQASLCTAEFFAARTGFGADTDAPIFIVGLPRAGSTLIEQILACHPQVEATMELADIGRLALELQGREAEGGEPRYPAVLAELGAGDFRQLGERYLHDTRIYRSGRPRFIDKMPNNFRHLGLIQLMLPNAKIIDARRDAMACCFSNFKQLFASGQEFTYSLADIARYYRSYVQLMSHWDRVLPQPVLRVTHQSVVDDLEGSVRRILDFCGLPFDPACIEFHRSTRSVRTASSEQVRQPIFRDGIDQWRHFEPYLGELRAALGELAGD